MMGAWCPTLSSRRCAASRSPSTATGGQTRSFCYVSDLVDGIYRLLLSNEVEPTNIGNPTEMTILQFAQEINRLTGNAGGIVHNPLPRRSQAAPAGHYEGT